MYNTHTLSIKKWGDYINHKHAEFKTSHTSKEKDYFIMINASSHQNNPRCAYNY